TKVVSPAMSKVAEALKEKGLQAEVARDDKDRLWIEVNHGAEDNFFYSVHIRPYTPPTFVMRDTSARRGEKLRYYRAEVYLKEGGQDYDLMDWNEEQVIADILDQYEKHMH